LRWTPSRTSAQASPFVQPAERVDTIASALSDWIRSSGVERACLRVVCVGRELTKRGLGAG
jgi:hypothetical protein